LGAFGHDVLGISESCPGISDDDLLELARSQGRLILNNEFTDVWLHSDACHFSFPVCSAFLCGPWDPWSVL